MADTLPPDIVIISPSHVFKNSAVEIQVVGNESLATYQSIYIVDKNGQKHELIFNHFDYKFVGLVNFQDIPIGMCTFYARVKDISYNFSKLVSKNIMVQEEIVMTIETTAYTFDADTSINELHNDTEVLERDIKMEVGK